MTVNMKDRKHYTEPVAEALPLAPLQLLDGSPQPETRTFDGIFSDEEHDPEEAL